MAQEKSFQRMSNRPHVPEGVVGISNNQVRALLRANLVGGRAHRGLRLSPEQLVEWLQLYKWIESRFGQGSVHRSRYPFTLPLLRKWSQRVEVNREDGTETEPDSEESGDESAGRTESETGSRSKTERTPSQSVCLEKSESDEKRARKGALEKTSADSKE